MAIEDDTNAIINGLHQSKIIHVALKAKLDERDPHAIATLAVMIAKAELSLAEAKVIAKEAEAHAKMLEWRWRGA